MAWDYQVDNLYHDVRSFLESHMMSELLDIIRIVVEEKEAEEGET